MWQAHQVTVVVREGAISTSRGAGSPQWLQLRSEHQRALEWPSALSASGGGGGGSCCLANLAQKLSVRRGACLTQVTAPGNSPSCGIMGSYQLSSAQNTFVFFLEVTCHIWWQLSEEVESTLRSNCAGPTAIFSTSADVRNEELDEARWMVSSLAHPCTPRPIV